MLALAMPSAPAQDRAGAVVVLERAGKVEFSPAGSQNWYDCHTNHVLYPGDRLRTGPRSRAAVRLSDLTVFRMGEQARLRIQPGERKRSSLDILRGIFYFFHRDNPGEFDVNTPVVSAVVRGTEFTVEVAEDDVTTITVHDGQVEMANEFGRLDLISGQQGRAERGKRPERTAVLEARNIIQWALYYPGVLDVEELGLAPAEQAALRDSLAAYRGGDLLTALEKYPAERNPASPREQIYLKALLLAVGQTSSPLLTSGVTGSRAVGQTSEVEVKMDNATAPFNAALDRVVAVVNSTNGTPAVSASSSVIRPPQTATEWMAESIYQQSRRDLDAALTAARHATTNAPRFGFAWARVAELEFSFGRVASARRAVQRSLEVSPRNAQALALMGFLLAAENRIPEAITWFDRAIAVDAALGNAWLGRGLARIRRGNADLGRQDIQMAAVVEPRRALFRSYLGKAFSHTGDNRRATNELALAMELDESDPTAWLYSALIKQQENDINEAVRDFERAQDLAENRAVYRSRLLLDQDRAVSGVNLATIYQDAGMTDVSVREATRAVNADYSVYSSHLFLANSYNAIRDQRLVSLRFETPAVSEYLVANLLAPVGAGILSPHVTQQEYSKLFERDRFGFASTTEYLSRGDWYQAASQFGTVGNTSYAIDVEYRSENGQRPNNDLEQFLGSLKIKQQLTPKDSIFIQGLYSDFESGDLRQYYNQDSAQRGLRVEERQAPIALLGYHREWSPNSHTLFLGGHLQDTLQVRDTNLPVLLFLRSTAGKVTSVPAAFRYPSLRAHVASNFNYRSEFDAYTVELQHILKLNDHTFIAGTRLQTGAFETESRITNTSIAQLTSLTSTNLPRQFARPNSQTVEEDFARVSAYAYDAWQIFEPLLLTVGLSYDWLEYPSNFRNAPLTPGKERRDQLSPKAGIIWTPLRDTTVRAAYTRSLAGVSFDQSFQLEPTQVGGFNQSYRSLIPESVAGAIAGAEFETWGVGVDQKFGSGTYLGAQAEWLRSEARRNIGILSFTNAFPNDPNFPNYDLIFRPDRTPQELEYQERTLLLTFNQLVGDHLSLGARYRLSDAEFETHLTEVSPSLGPRAHVDVRAILHQVNLFALAYHPSGFFGQFDSIWSRQSNQGYSPDLPGDDFWQFNVYAGYRFPRRQAEVRVGLLNLTDQDYQLNPLNLTPELPRDRTLLLSLRFHF